MTSVTQKSVPFITYSSYLRKRYGRRVQKVGIDAGFTCPNRDGSLGTGGCTYCSISSIRPEYCRTIRDVPGQIRSGISFFDGKYRDQGYIAYFQSYSNTYGDPSVLENMYRQVLEMPEILGVSVATRPDCISPEIVAVLHALQNEYQKEITLELGVETTEASTLTLINRGHSPEQSKAAVEQAVDSGLRVCAHLILGLPGETLEQQVRHGTRISRWGAHGVKIHHLQILKGSPMAEHYLKDRWPQGQKPTLYTLDQYIPVLSRAIQAMRPDLVIERLANDAPQDMILAPRWGGIKNYALSQRVADYMVTQGLSQGQAYQEVP